MTKDKPANRLCACGHIAEKHWLAGGELKTSSDWKKAHTGRVPYTSDDGDVISRFDDWPPYYRAECTKCDCEGFVAVRKRKTA